MCGGLLSGPFALVWRLVACCAAGLSFVQASLVFCPAVLSPLRHWAAGLCGGPPCGPFALVCLARGLSVSVRRVQEAIDGTAATATS